LSPKRRLITAVGNLRELEDLNLNDNRNLQSLPASMANMTKLKRILLRNTLVESIPSNILRCWTAMLELNLRDNPQIGAIPSTSL
jgi:Leucine-rich repeat (LRR) protein